MYHHLITLVNLKNMRRNRIKQAKSIHQSIVESKRSREERMQYQKVAPRLEPEERESLVQYLDH